MAGCCLHWGNQQSVHGIMGRRFPDGGLLRYRKWVPQQLGDVIVVTNSPPIGQLSPLPCLFTSPSCWGTHFLYLSKHPHLGTSFPLFHATPPAPHLRTSEAKYGTVAPCLEQVLPPLYGRRWPQTPSRSTSSSSPRTRQGQTCKCC